MAQRGDASEIIRIAIVSDIHGNLAALEAVVADLKHRNVESVVNLGDHVSGPLLPGETAQFLMAQEWIHLAGNHERQLLTLKPEESIPSDAYALSKLTRKELAWMAELKPSCALGKDILLCHGTPTSDTQYFLETVMPDRFRPATQREIEMRLGGIKARVIACGHTHLPRSVRSAAGQLIINPGSVGLPAYDDEQPFHHVIENGSPDARYAIIEKRGGRWSSELIAVSYNFKAMARLARLRGRRDWESALLFGYLNSPKSSFPPTADSHN